MTKKYHVDLVRDFLHQIITRDSLQAGDPLPPEGQIAAELDISRGSVREAVKALEGIGLLEVRHGNGLFLRGFNLDAFLEMFRYSVLLDPGTIAKLYEIRRLLETAMMPEVVSRVTDTTILECKQVLENWEGAIERKQTVYEHDRMFHRILYSPIDNAILSELCDIFWYAFKNAELDGYRNKELLGREYDEAAILEAHREILRAVEARNADAATRQMNEHFKEIARRLEVTARLSSTKPTAAKLQDSSTSPKR